MKRAVFALVLALACSKHESAPVATATAPDPCTLITADDLKQITSVPVREGSAAGDANVATKCVWQEGGEAGAGAITVGIHVSGIELLLGQLRQLPGNEKLDLGEESFWSNAINQLTVRTGDRVVTVNFNTSGGAAEHKAQAIEIAKKVIAQL